MAKIDNAFDQALKNGQIGKNGWRFGYVFVDKSNDEEDVIVLQHSKTKLIRSLSEQEKLFLKISGIDNQIKYDAERQLLAAIFKEPQNKNKYLYVDEDEYYKAIRKSSPS